jgi:uncharacterized protein Yka (UPF0111/DUF47 family)
MGLRELLIPREKIFFQLLEEESKNVLAGAVAFTELIQNFDHLPDKRNQIKDKEHHGDEIVHSIYDRLVKTFITPIDREDISKLASLYDDVLDYIYAAVNRLFLYEVDSPTEPMRRFADLMGPAQPNGPDRKPLRKKEGSFNSSEERRFLARLESQTISCFGHNRLRFGL